MMCTAEPARSIASAIAAAASITCSQVSSTSNSAPLGERLRHTLRRNLAAAKLEPDSGGNRGGNQPGIGERRELGQPHAVGKVRQQLARKLRGPAASCRCRRRRSG